mgnify:CR=1 FL=1
MKSTMLFDYLGQSASGSFAFRKARVFSSFPAQRMRAGLNSLRTLQGQATLTSALKTDNLTSFRGASRVLCSLRLVRKLRALENAPQSASPPLGGQKLKEPHLFVLTLKNMT